MTGLRWVTVTVVVALVLAAMTLLFDVRDRLPRDGSPQLDALSDPQVAAIRKLVGEFPTPPCDPSVPSDALPDDVRKRCNRHYLAVVKAARAMGHGGVRVRDVREPGFYSRLLHGSD